MSAAAGAVLLVSARTVAVRDHRRIVAALVAPGVDAGAASGRRLTWETVQWLGGVGRRRRSVRLASQLADGVRAVAGGLRSGASLSGSLASAAAESPQPVSGALSRIVARETAGAGLDDGLARWAAEARDDDVGLVVAALRIHRRAGGDLPSVLDRLAGTLDQRTACRREVRSLTAQARLSGLVVGLLPVGFFAFLSLTSPGDMAAAYASPIGAFAIVAGLLLEGGAFLWIRRLLRVDA